MSKTVTLPTGWTAYENLFSEAYHYSYSDRIVYYVVRLKFEHRWFAGAIFDDGQEYGPLTYEDSLMPIAFKTVHDAIDAVMANAGDHDPDECFFGSVNGMPYIVRSPLYNESALEA